jgi:hypothetical protein
VIEKTFRVRQLHWEGKITCVLSVSLRREGLGHVGSDPRLWSIDQETLRC